MKKYRSLLLFLLSVMFTLPSFAQVNAVEDSSEKNVIFVVVEKMPSFPGGTDAMMEYLSQSVKYPKPAQDNGIEGRVIVGFVVEKDGSISQVKIVRGVDPLLDAEAIRVVQEMPTWIPGEQRAKAVRVSYNLPINFRLTKDE